MSYGIAFGGKSGRRADQSHGTRRGCARAMGLGRGSWTDPSRTGRGAQARAVSDMDRSRQRGPRWGAPWAVARGHHRVARTRDGARIGRPSKWRRDRGGAGGAARGFTLELGGSSGCVTASARIGVSSVTTGNLGAARGGQASNMKARAACTLHDGGANWCKGLRKRRVGRAGG